ncbi:hypothetical protein ACOMHN_041883 [Nucella lapillus]
MDNVATPPPSRNVLGFMVPSPKEMPGLDPYAFPADDSGPSPRVLSTKPMQLSVHPRTLLPPGNPLPHNGSHYQRAADFFQQQQQQQQFPASLHSPVHGSQPSQPDQQFTHPSSRLENDTVVCGQMDQVMKQVYFQSTGGEISPSSGFMADAHLTVEKAKKKKKPKKNLGEDKEMNMLQPVNAGSFPPLQRAMIDNTQSVGTGSLGRVDYKTHADVMTETTSFGTKSPASVLSSSGDSNSMPPGQSPGSHGIPCFPTTTSATTFTNSLPSVPLNRRLSSDSVELPISRPASRTSTVSTSSGSSEGKLKEAAESVSLSKILEIIEREKMLGSSNPCKRRRTAKPQHIQEAEEEAKKFAAANTPQGGGKDATATDSVPPSPSQPSSKKHLLTNSTSQTKNIPAGLLQGKDISHPYLLHLRRTDISHPYLLQLWTDISHPYLLQLWITDISHPYMLQLWTDISHPYMLQLWTDIGHPYLLQLWITDISHPYMLQLWTDISHPYMLQLWTDISHPYMLQLWTDISHPYMLQLWTDISHP